MEYEIMDETKRHEDGGEMKKNYANGSYYSHFLRTYIEESLVK
jgi:hypothetical protein